MSAPVDAIDILTGTTPPPGEPSQLLADAGNQAATGAVTPVGASVAVRTAAGPRNLRVSGTAHSLATSPSANNGAGGPVFYASEATVRSLAGIGDPTTAYQNSVAMARDLGRARLLTVEPNR